MNMRIVIEAQLDVNYISPTLDSSKNQNSALSRLKNNEHEVYTTPIPSVWNQTGEYATHALLF